MISCTSNSNNVPMEGRASLRLVGVISTAGGQRRQHNQIHTRQDRRTIPLAFTRQPCRWRARQAMEKLLRRG